MASNYNVIIFSIKVYQNTSTCLSIYLTTALSKTYFSDLIKDKISLSITQYKFTIKTTNQHQVNSLQSYHSYLNLYWIDSLHTCSESTDNSVGRQQRDQRWKSHHGVWRPPARSERNASAAPSLVAPRCSTTGRIYELIKEGVREGRDFHPLLPLYAFVLGCSHFSSLNQLLHPPLCRPTSSFWNLPLFLFLSVLFLFSILFRHSPPSFIHRMNGILKRWQLSKQSKKRPA